MRDMALQAREQSGTLREFQGCLRMADIDMEVRKNRIYLVDRDNRDHAVRADRLDRSLSAKELSRVFADSLKVDQRGKERIREKRLATELRREIERGRLEGQGDARRNELVAEMRRDKAISRKQERGKPQRAKERTPKRAEEKQAHALNRGKILPEISRGPEGLRQERELKHEGPRHER